MRGICLSGGRGTRLHPLTKRTSKQLLPVFDRPMVNYPLHTLQVLGIEPEMTAIIVTPESRHEFNQVLGEHYFYIEQKEPEGIAQAPILAEEWLNGDDFVLILGDNLFTAPLSIERELRRREPEACMIFSAEVNNPERYGCISYDPEIRLVEKPTEQGRYKAVTGIYYFPNNAVTRAKKLKKSARGELEIIDLIKTYGEDVLIGYLDDNGWFDMGTFDDLADAIAMIRCLRHRHKSKLGFI